MEHPLPLPTWDVMDKEALKINSLEEYDEIARNIESHVQKLLEEHNYNTVGNFVKLYQGFKQSSCSSLAEFFQSYSPPITEKHHTCVGLALELWKKLYALDDQFAGLTNHLYLVSCEESIGVFNEYPALYNAIDHVGAILEKEHVLLAMKIEVCGREGIMLCDPGYHVGRVVTVMKDYSSPHTGWFTQSHEANLHKEYNYVFSTRNANFIEWYERTTRNTKMEEIHSLIYVEKPYLTAVDVTERRNLVYSFRSLLARDQKGHLLAGIYFKVKEYCDEFTIFYQDDGKKQRLKLNFSEFLQEDRINEVMLNIIKKCNQQLNLGDDELLGIIRIIGGLFNDKSYVSQLLDINTCINNMTEASN